MLEKRFPSAKNNSQIGTENRALMKEEKIINCVKDTIDNKELILMYCRQNKYKS